MYEFTKLYKSVPTQIQCVAPLRVYEKHISVGVTLNQGWIKLSSIYTFYVACKWLKEVIW